MYNTEQLKKQFGDMYQFERYLSESEVKRLLAQNIPDCSIEIKISLLTVGCMKIEAVIYKKKDGLTVGYDVFVKDSPDSIEWICYDNPDNAVCLDDKNMESKMLKILNTIVNDRGLSYTECRFETIKGKKSGKE